MGIFFLNSKNSFGPLLAKKNFFLPPTFMWSVKHTLASAHSFVFCKWNPARSFACRKVTRIVVPSQIARWRQKAFWAMAQVLFNFFFIVFCLEGDAPSFHAVSCVQLVCSDFFSFFGLQRRWTQSISSFFFLLNYWIQSEKWIYSF